MIAERAALAGLAAAVGGCSLGTFDHDECSRHDDCRAAFGMLSTCGDDGFCKEAQLAPRCSLVPPEPEDLFTRPERHTTTLLLGNILDHTSTTKNAEHTVRLAFQQVNDEGGYEGRMLGVLFCSNGDDIAIDALDDKAASAEIARYMSGTLGIPGIIGAGSSEWMTAAFAEVEPNAGFFITPAATSPTLTALDPANPTDDDPGLLWRTAPTDALEARVIAGDLLSRNVLRISLILEQGSYGEGFITPFADAYALGGGQAAIFSFDTDAGLAEATTNAAAQAVTEVFIMTSQKDQLMAFLGNVPTIAAYADKQILLTHGGVSQSMVDELAPTLGASAPALFAKVRGARPAQRSSDSATYDVFAASYRAAFPGEDPSDVSWSAHRYDASWLTFYGVAWSLAREGALTGKGIARGLRRVSAPGVAPTEVLPSKWAAVVEAFRAGSPINVKGASGGLDFDPVTEETNAPIEVFAIVPDATKPSGFAIKTETIVD